MQGLRRFQVSVGLLLFGLSTPVFGVTAGWQVKLNSDEEKLSFLLGLNKRIPSIIRESSQNKVDLFVLLENQKRLFDSLKRLPNYLESLESEELVQIDVLPPSEGLPVGPIHVSSVALDSWKIELLKELRELQGESEQGSFSDGLKAGIEAFWGVEARQQLARVLGLVENLKLAGEIPKTASGRERDLLRAQQAEVNAILSKRGNDPLECWVILASGYLEKWEKVQDLLGFHGITEEALQEARSVLGQLNRLRKSLDVLIFSGVGRLPLSSWTWSILESRLQDLSADDLRSFYFQEIELIQEVERVYGMQHNLVDSESADLSLRKVLTDSLLRRMRYFVRRSFVSQSMASVPVRLVQVPPLFGIFRGFVGSDCSSKASFPYPNDPQELVFFVVNPNHPDRMKGYVSASRVLRDGAQALYVHTISGSHISAGDVELILRGLDRVKERLGASAILIPRKETALRMMSFSAIVTVFESHLRGSSLIEFQYPSAPIREKIESFRPQESYNFGDYDHSYQHRWAAEVRFPDRNLASLRVKVDLVESDFYDLSAQSELDRESLFEFLMESRQGGQDEIFLRLFQIPKVRTLWDPKMFDDLIAMTRGVSTRADAESVDTLKERIVHEIHDRFKLPSEYLNSHQRLLFPGLLYCTNAFAESEVENTAELIVEALKKRGFQAEGFPWELIRTQLSEGSLGKTRAFQRLYRQLAEGLRSSAASDVIFAAEAVREVIYVNDEIIAGLISGLERTDVLPLQVGPLRRSVVMAISRVSPRTHALADALLAAAKAEKNSTIMNMMGRVLSRFTSDFAEQRRH